MRNIHRPVREANYSSSGKESYRIANRIKYKMTINVNAESKLLSSTPILDLPIQKASNCTNWDLFYPSIRNVSKKKGIIGIHEEIAYSFSFG
ncbi:unnamed protein product [Sphenostylis stenocarpa]|uniref:Uncharacterized protein n=1 Tax=Sphenostylis stenocarpa TaxID=92480 RepID=A0AA86VDF4_9FABA|nr:unnamed protein product [Sphenostylis stenocarpa]